jgi:uncharacterized DUF497 family protein
MDVGFVWDETKYKTVVREHNVNFYEVVAAFDGSAGYEVLGVDRTRRSLALGRQNTVGSVVNHHLYRAGLTALSNHHGL